MAENLPCLKRRLEQTKEDFVHSCIACGQCVEACPYQSSGVLGDRDPVEISEKRLALLKEHEYSDEAYIFSRGCLVCGACQASCPLGLNPYLINIICRVELARWDGPVSQRYAKDTSNIRALLPAYPYNIFRVLYGLQIEFSEVAWISETPENPPPTDVILFLSCQAMAHADRILTMMDMLRAMGIRFEALGGVDFCCGFLNLLSGDIEGAQGLLSQLVRTVEAFKTTRFVVGCTTCYGWFMDLSRLGLFPFKCQHFTQFVADHLERLDFKRPMRRQVTFHDACHMGRRPEEYEAPRKILRAIPGIRLLEMEHSREETICCGSPAQAFQPNLASELQKARLEEARKTGADLLLTACDGCASFLSMGAESYPFRVDVVDQVVAEALGIRHEDRLKTLLACRSVEEALRIARGRLWEGMFTEAELREVVGSILKMPDR